MLTRMGRLGHLQSKVNIDPKKWADARLFTSPVHPLNFSMLPQSETCPGIRHEFAKSLKFLPPPPSLDGHWKESGHSARYRGTTAAIAFTVQPRVSWADLE